MIKQVQGYVTSDGRFYESQSEAEFHEATEMMLAVLKQHEMSEDLLEFLTSNAVNISKFLQAWNKFNDRTKEYKGGGDLPHAPDIAGPKVRRV